MTIRRSEVRNEAASPPSEAWLFAQQLLGKPIPRVLTAESGVASSAAEQSIAGRHQLGDDNSHSRRLLEWAAQISSEAAAKLREVEHHEMSERAAWERAERFCEAYWAGLCEWNEADHPREPKGTSAGGQFARKDGGTAGGKASSSSQIKASKSPAKVPSAPDSSRWHLPATTKGEWAGEKGNSVFRLNTPVDAGGGKLIHEIEFRGGAPVLDKFALPGKTATIILTGDHPTDIANARKAWMNLNPGVDLPNNATFHHDLLHATEETIDIGGRKVKVLVGKMQLIPRVVNQAVYHEGTAAVAKKYYQGLGIDVKPIAELARKEANSAQSKIISRATKKIKPGKVLKGLAPFVGRTVLRAIPLVGSGLAIIEFAENAEAHGIGGAVARATPLLGDLISAADLGSELAKGIRDEADAAAGEAQRQLNEPARRAWEEADAQTIAAFNDLAPQIKVTNVPRTGDGKGLVDADEIATALFLYREAMQNANFKRNTGKNQVDFEAEAAQNKEQLRQRLEDASQKRRPTVKGPLT